MKHHTIDTSIPTLTEIIAAPANEPAPAQEPTPAPAPRPTLEQLLEPTIWSSEATNPLPTPAPKPESKVSMRPAADFASRLESRSESRFIPPSELDAMEPPLTEQIIPSSAAPPVVAAVVAPPAPELAAVSPAAKPAVAELTAEPTIGWSAEEREILELQLNERILRQLQGRIDFVLEHRVRDSLADVLQTAIEGLTSEIRRGLHQTLEEVIARAVAQEIARLQTPKK